MDIIAVSLVALLLSGFFSGAETALFSLTEAKVELLIEKRLKYANLIKNLKSNPQRLITLILVGNNIVNIGASSAITYLVSVRFGDAAIGLATGVMTFMVLIFGEIFPKILASHFNIQFSQIVALPLTILNTIFAPIVIGFAKLTHVVISCLNKGESDQKVSEEGIRAMLRLSHDDGEIESYEQSIIEKVFLLNDQTVKDIMVPIDATLYIDETKNLRIAVNEVKSNRFNRIPVMGSKGEFIGYIYLRDYFKLSDTEKDKKTICTLMRKGISFDAATSLHTAFFEMIKSSTHMGFVIEEGKSIGIITLEDILEELFGEIQDESD